MAKALWLVPEGREMNKPSHRIHNLSSEDLLFRKADRHTHTQKCFTVSKEYGMIHFILILSNVFLKH